MMTDWAIPQQAKLKYTQLFNLHDRSRSGFLSGVQCRDILMQSGLPRAILAEIWNLSDIDGDGQLTREEFILAMHLTNQARAGQPLPQELPVDLVPPSYRRTRSISTTSVHSAASSVGSISEQVPSTIASVTAASSINDDQLSQKSADITAATFNAATTGSILNTNSFEDKRRENFEKGRAELERRRLKIIEQQTSILSEQLVKCKKQVADAKSKIDSMRSERDTKAGLITSLEAQLKTIRERKAFLDHEEMQIIAIARDLNLVNSPHSADLDQQATIAKQASINQMKENLVELEKEKGSAAKQLAEAQARLDELKKELKTVSGEVTKTFETYKEKIANAKVLRQQFIEENKSKPIDLQSAWDSTPSQAVSQVSAFKTEPVSTFPASNDDPWSTTDTFPSTTKQPFDDPFAFTSSKSVPQSGIASNNNNDSDFEPARDFSSFSSISPKQKEQSADGASNSFNESSAPELTQRKKMYRVLYEFEARNPDELTINPGDIIIGSEVVCEPGWLSGEINGRSGLFPEAYVEPLPSEERPMASGFESNLSASATTSQGTTRAASQEPARQASPTTSTIVKYKVIYAFEARNPDELTINPGDIITGVDLPHEPGWLMGELNGQRGLFPEAYVERLAEAQVDPATEQMGKSRAKKAEVATVIANYRALGQEQLNLEKGQLVLIRRKMDSGWWEGELQIKGKKKQFGWFPSSYVKLL
uniref:Intersectin-1 n=1 Tax=Aceria tosichella TaxID=561515 RepID=A0A6G1SIY0_9ACAR